MVSDAISGQRLLIVEEALKGPIGHWYEYVKSVAELNRGAGVEVTVAAHRDIDPDIAAEINAIPAFPQSNWDGVYAHPQAWRRYWGIVSHNWLVYRTMSRIIDRHGPFDCLFAPTVVIHHIWGWRLLLARKRGKIGRMVLLFRNNAGSYPPGSITPVFKRSAIVLKWALRSFAAAIGKGQVAFATDSSRLAREYELLCGIIPEVYPSPRIAPFPDASRPAKRAEDPIVFSSLGPARFEKGIDVLQQAIHRSLTQGLQRPVKFVIQWNQPIRNSDGSLYPPDSALLADPRVEFITEALDSNAYEAAIAATDCMLLPYRRDSYFARISGVAVEAATAGIPMIYTTDTWTADLVESVGAGAAIEDGDVPGLTDAIRKLAEHYDEYSQQALERSVAAQATHSSAAFLDKLWGRQ